MSDHTKPGTGPILPDHLGDVCRRFQEAWKGVDSSEKAPCVEDYLADVPASEQTALLLRLVDTELFHRCRRGELPRPEEYRSRFPLLDPDWLADRIAAQPPSAGDETVGDRFLTGPYAPTPSAGPEGAAESVLPWEARRGPALPGYEVLGVLGRGGMGVVYKARQRGLNRVVALKVIRAGAHASPEERARFQAEAVAVAHLQHPNIVQVHEVGEYDGLPFFSLELVDGGSLANRLAGNPQLPAEAARLAESLARAMHAAHERGIIHRDLKPANVLLASGGHKPPVASTGGLCPPLADFTPKITDFGLAKRFADDSWQTQTGQVLGTPAYMSPEQAAGRTSEVGPATDVYALGAILYEMLTGRPPFRAATAMETLDQVRHQEPVPPSRLLPKCPRDLETICLKCLRKEPRKRYATALELADDLRRFLANEPIAARPVGAWERAVKWSRRRPAVAALLALVVLVTAVGFGLVTWKWLEAEHQRQQAESARRDAEQKALDEERAKGVADAARKDAEEQRNQARLALEQSEVNQYHTSIGLAEREWGANNPARAEELLDGCPPRLCRWEWYYLKRLCRAERLALPGQACVAVSRDGRLIAAAGAEMTVRVWEVDTGRERHVFRGHREMISGVCFSPDGKRLASAAGIGSRPGEVKVWDLATGREAVQVPRPADGVEGVAWSPDGRFLAAAVGQFQKPSCVVVWEVDSGRETFTLRGHEDAVLCVAFSPDSKHIASGGADRMVKVWDVDDGKEVRTLRGHVGYVFALAFSPDGKRLASASHMVVKLWDPADGKEVGELRGHTERVEGVAFSPDSKRLASACLDRTVRVWDVATRREVACLRGHAAGVSAVAFTPDGQGLVSAEDWATSVRAVKVWDLAGGPAARALSGYAGMGAVAFSPDGRLLASIGEKHTVRLWDPRTWKELAPLAGHEGHITALTFSPDSKLLASCSWDDTVRLWDPHGSKELRRFRAEEDVNGLAFRPDGKVLAAVSHNNVVQLWDLESGQELRRLRTRGGGTTGVVFSADGKRLVVSGIVHGMRPPAVLLCGIAVLDAETGQEVQALGGQVGPVFCLTRSADGRYLASGSGNDTTGDLRVWDAATGEEVFALRGHARTVYSVAFSPDGKRLASASADNTVRLWDLGTGRELLSLRHYLVKGVCFSPDGRCLVTAGVDKMLRVWEAAPGPVFRSLRGHADSVRAVAVSPDGKLLASAGRDNTIRLWDGDSGAAVRTLSGHTSDVAALAFSPDGKTLASSSEDRTVRFWDAGSGRQLGRLDHAQAVRGLAFSPDGARLASGDAGGTIRLWDAASAREVLTLSGHRGAVISLAFSPDGGRLVSTGADKTARVWDPRAGKELFTLRGHVGFVNGAVISPDGSRIATAGADRTVRLWDLAAGECRLTLEGHDSSVYSVTFRPDGTRLASSGYDGTVRVWDAAVGRELFTLRGHVGPALGVTFHPDGKRLASAGWDTTVKLWDLDTPWPPGALPTAPKR